MSPAVIYIKTILLRTLGAVLPPAMSPRSRGAGGKSSVGARLPKRADVYMTRNSVLCELWNVLSRAPGIEDRTCK